MDLNAPQRQQLQDALLDAFPRWSALKQTVDYGLDENLEKIAGNSNLSDAVHELITWARARDRIEELISTALRFNPSNVQLGAFAQQVGITLDTVTKKDKVILPPQPPSPLPELRTPASPQTPTGINQGTTLPQSPTTVKVIPLRAELPLQQPPAHVTLPNGYRYLGKLEEGLSTEHLYRERDGHIALWFPAQPGVLSPFLIDKYAPTLQQVVLNGASRHSLNKGFILVRDASHSVDIRVRDTIVAAVNQRMAQQEDLAGFTAEGRPAHPSLMGLTTPFLPVYDMRQRDAFINSLAKATSYLLQEAARSGCRLVVAGVNPCFADGDGQPLALCADIHQVEAFDEGEIERIYNLYRQFLPELLALSTHSSIYGAAVQKDFSLRMRVNPSSFLPRYLSQFSTKHLDQLERMMRKDYGLADLRQMDVNPLGGDAALLIMQNNLPLLGKTAAAVELRFVDAQCSFPLIRAQIIIFQSIAMYGRSLAREGKRLPYMRDEVIDENKALVIQGGAGAVLKPDARFKKDDSSRGYSYHDKGMPERATTALLMTIDGLLLPALRDLGCQVSELAPILLGAELRQRGKRCLANYAEYQQYLYYTQQRQFVTTLQRQTEQLLTTPSLDFVSNYNRSTYAELTKEIETTWEQKLIPRPRYKGQVKWYSAQKGEGFIRSEEVEELYVRKNDIEGESALENGQPVSFEILKRGERSLAVRVRVEVRPQHSGRLTRFDEARGFGFIADNAGGNVFVHRSDVLDGVLLHVGDLLQFEVTQTDRGLQAARVRVQECPHVMGKVKWFDPQKRFGYIAQTDGKEIFVHQSDLEGMNALRAGQSVRFEVVQSNKGLKAVHVCARVEEQAG